MATITTQEAKEVNALLLHVFEVRLYSQEMLQVLHCYSNYVKIDFQKFPIYTFHGCTFITDISWKAGATVA